MTHSIIPPALNESVDQLVKIYGKCHAEAIKVDYPQSSLKELSEKFDECINEIFRIAYHVNVNHYAHTEALKHLQSRAEDKLKEVK